MTSPSPDLEPTPRYLTALGITAAQWQTFLDHKGDPTARSLARTPHGTLESVKRELLALNRKGAGIFVQVNAGVGRGVANITVVRAFFCEVDKVDGRPATYGEALERFARFPLRPTLTARPYKGGHNYYVVTDASLETWPRIQLALALLVEGDTALTNLDRVMRVPGFLHQKNPDDPRPVTLEVCEPERVYTEAEVVAALGGWEAVEARIAAHEEARRAERQAQVRGATPAAPRPNVAGREGEGRIAEAQRRVALRFVLREFGWLPPERDGEGFECLMSEHSSVDSARILTGEDGIERLVCRGESCQGKGHASASGLPTWDAFGFLTDPNGGGLSGREAYRRLLEMAGTWEERRGEHSPHSWELPQWGAAGNERCVERDRCESPHPRTAPSDSSGWDCLGGQSWR